MWIVQLSRQSLLRVHVDLKAEGYNSALDYSTSRFFWWLAQGFYRCVSVTKIFIELKCVLIMLCIAMTYLL